MEFFRATYTREDGSEYTVDFGAWSVTEWLESDEELWAWAIRKAMSKSLEKTDRIKSVEYLGE